MMTKNSNKIKVFKLFLDKAFPDAKCELTYQRDYELLIAVVLSAQTTDRAVNLVTPILFSRFDTLLKLKEAPLADIEDAIRPIGLYRNKATSVKGIAAMLVDEFGGVVPSVSSELLRLPGVGNKTRNVIQAELFSIPTMAVDTHVERISKRLGIASEKDNPDAIEKKLRRLLEPKDFIKTNHQIIEFGRQVCHARNPQCKTCVLNDLCKYYRQSA
ncbi:MAG: endonuclease III [Bacilli bacterium]|jgi:endonuclease-3